MGWFSGLWSTDRRRVKRDGQFPLVAHYWDGAAPEPHQVREISPEGMYLVTEQRWYPNTLIMMTLTRSDKPVAGPGDSIAVAARVVRAGTDGVGFAFILPPSLRASNAADSSAPEEADKKTMKKFLERLHAGV